jgi:hypothetical protein
VNTSTATNIKLTCNRGTKTLTIKQGKGVIDNAAKTVFTRGHCHSFAYALHELTGWTIAGVSGDAYSPAHCVVWCAELDDFVDIGGPGAVEREFPPRRYGKPDIYYYDYEPEAVLNFYAYRDAEVEDAMPFAKTVLTSLKKRIKKAQAKHAV